MADDTELAEKLWDFREVVSVHRYLVPDTFIDCGKFLQQFEHP
jgi:hypothetical protein